ncbi:cytochrome c biogenesis protein CcdA [Halobacteriales archaeon Cl-PHB]
MTSAEVAGATSLAFGAGVATFFSPCAYALLPGYVGYYVQASEGEATGAPLSGAVVRGLAAFAGVAAVFAVLSAAILALGRSIQPVLDVLEPLVGVLLVGLGGIVLAGWSPGWHATLPQRRSSVLGFAVFGAVYAVAAAGCVAPFFLAVMLKAVTFPPAAALVVVGAYAVGFGLLMLGATVAIAVGRDALVQWLGNRQGVLNAAAGVVLVLAGIGQLYVAL